MRTKPILLAFTFVLATTVSAAAQVTGQPYRISDRELIRLLNQIKSETKNYRNSLKEALSKNRFDRTQGEDDNNAYDKDFVDQTKGLDDNFNHRRSKMADGDSVLQH